MYIDKKNYWLRLPLIDKFLKRLILKNRIKIYRIFEENTNFDENTNIIDVGTTPILDSHEKSLNKLKLNSQNNRKVFLEFIANLKNVSDLYPDNFLDEE